MTDNIFKRVELVLNKENLKAINTSKVIVFGVGGVGSWCVESLVRTGIENITLVDFDTVCPTNVNRQLQATMKTIGKLKVEVLKERLLEINPNAKITAISEKYSRENASEFNLNEYDYVIDAIDMIDSKIELIKQGCNSAATLFSSMGAAKKLDPTRVQVANVWKTHGCGLAKAVRNRLKKERFNQNFTTVFSDELIENQLTEPNQPNGSLIFVTATFGLTLASLVIRDIVDKNEPIKRVR